MEELFPIACGLVIGLLFGVLRPRIRWVVCGIAAALAGLAATVISGEFRVSWAFLLIDIPLVVVVACGTRVLSIAALARLRPTGDNPPR